MRALRESSLLYAPKTPEGLYTTVKELRAFFVKHLGLVLNGMDDLVEQIDLAGRRNDHVLILGESGTGKGRIARAIHLLRVQHGNACKEMVEVNCAAIAQSLVESELFGHMKGSFTDALRDRVGMVENADGGRIFFDEIGELPEYIQAKLLRLLEEGEVRRVGSNKSIHVDIQALAATSGGKSEKSVNGIPPRLRHDLYYRLAANVIHVPALRERPIEARRALIEDAFSRASQRTILGEKWKPAVEVDDEVISQMLELQYPGNNRELLSIAASIYGRAEQATESQVHLPELIRIDGRHATAVLMNGEKYSSSEPEMSRFANPNLAYNQDQIFLDLLEYLKAKHNSNITEIAAEMGIYRQNLYRKLGRIKEKRAKENS